MFRRVYGGRWSCGRGMGEFGRLGGECIRGVMVEDTVAPSHEACAI